MLSSEVVAAVGVFLGLLFVGWEIRQNTLAARATAYQAMGGAVSSMWLDAAADPGRARVWLRFHEVEIAESPDRYSDEDIDQMIVQMIGALRQFETTWRQVQLGLLAAQALAEFGWNTDNRPGPANLKYLWPRMKPHMSPDFAAVVEDTFFS
jgi:hypothetical protein